MKLEHATNEQLLAVQELLHIAWAAAEQEVGYVADDFLLRLKAAIDALPELSDAAHQTNPLFRELAEKMLTTLFDRDTSPPPGVNGH